MRSGAESKPLRRVLVAALVCALPLCLRPHLLHEGRGGLDFDEVEDPFHRRLKILEEVGCIGLRRGFGPE